MIGFDYTLELDEYRHRNYRIGVRVNPSFNDVQEFAVVLYHPQRDGSHENVAKIDNSDIHDGEIHLDKLYREDDAEEKDYEIDVESWDEAVDHIEDRWRKFADLHYENHGD